MKLCTRYFEGGAESQNLSMQFPEERVPEDLKIKTNDTVQVAWNKDADFLQRKYKIKMNNPMDNLEVKSTLEVI